MPPPLFTSLYCLTAQRTRLTKSFTPYLIMSFPVQITFRHMDPSAAVEARIREEAAWLERYFPRIVSVRVVVEAPHGHHRRGHGYDVSVRLIVPRAEIVANHHPSPHSTLVQDDAGHNQKHLEVQPEHKDVYVSIRDAFMAARRQLEDYARTLRSDVKHHGEIEPPSDAS